MVQKFLGFFIAVFFISQLSITPLALAADDYDDYLMEEDELAMIYGADVIVTASKREQKISESPSAVSVITSEDIKQSGATQLGEVLNLIVGTHFGYTTATHMLAGGMRGFHKLPANKIVLLIDGVPYSFEVYGMPSIFLMPIAVEEIERIEVLRGAGSSLYGANAMFGVINVITKKAKDTEGSLVSLSAGNNGLFLSTLMTGGEIIEDSLFYRLTASTEQRDGFGYIAYTDDPVLSLQRLSADIDYLVGDNATLNVLAGYARTPHIYSTQTSTGPVNFEDSEVMFTTINLNFEEPNIVIRANISHKDLWDSGWALGTDEAHRTIKLKMGTRMVEVQHTLEPIEGDILSWGLNFSQVYAEGPSLGGDRRHDMHGVFVDNTYSFDEKLSLNTGARLDHHPNTTDSISHRVSMLYSPYDEHSLRFTWATSFRNPDFIESYYDAIIGGPYTAKGHEDNLAEKAEMFEVGYRGLWFDDLELNANVFYTEVADLIAFKHTSTYTYEHINVENIKQYGFELETEYAFTDYLIGKLNYTYYDMWEEAADTMEFVKQTPQHMANANLRAYFENGFSTNISAQYCGQSTYPYSEAWADPRGTTIGGGKQKAYLIANLRIGYEFYLMENDAEVALSALNIFDKKFDDYGISTADIGRTLYATFIYKF